MVQPFTAAPHHDVLLLLLQMAVLLASARLLGELALRLGQPSVVGEISAGIILGPSCLSGLFPQVAQLLVPQNPTGGYLLEAISMIGAMFLLLITGLETDVKLIKRHARTAAGVSVGGILTTFGSGFALGMVLPDQLLARPDQRLVFSLFVATALSISAIPVIAKVLMDMNLMRRDVGQTILAAGMSDDTSGWILLSIVASLASGAAITATTVGLAVLKVLFFLVLSFTLGRWLVRRSLEYVQDEFRSRYRLVTVVMVYTFLFGAFSLSLGLEAVLGAFVVGILLSELRRLPKDVPHLLENVALGIFAPIFFGVAGLKVDVKALASPELFLYALLVIAVACGGKVVGTYWGARLIGGKDHWTALSFGAGLNARGAMEIIIATIGLSLGILSQSMFSIIVLMAMVTSLMAPSALRYTLSKVLPSKEELERLEREEREEKSPLADLHRVLLPVRSRTDGPGANQMVESAIFRMLHDSGDLSLTLMTVVPNGTRSEGQTYLDGLAPLFSSKPVVKRVIEGTDTASAILDESKKDYQLLMIGAAEDSDQGSLFSPAIDELVRLASCPTLIFSATAKWDREGTFDRILVPTNGSDYSMRATEFAFKLASGTSSAVEFVHVVVRDGRSRLLEHQTDQLEYDLGRGQQMVSRLVAMGESAGINCSGEVRVHASVAAGILEVAARHQVDLMLLGTNVRPGGPQLYLGAEVERVLKNRACPVIVINA